MAPSITPYPSCISQSSPSITAVCKTRTGLLDLLAIAVADLERATSDLTETLLEEGPVDYETAAHEVRRLRNDCSSIRTELERHRAEHGC